MWQEVLTQLEWMIGVVVSILLGFIIGYERKLRRKEAGIGTHTVVCMGAALMVVVSKYGFEGEADAARVAAQIVSGIGFLGAGIIVYRQHEIHGLTTAAGVWATAGVGMACGAKLYVIATCATVLMVLVQCIYHSPLKIFRSKRYYVLNIVFTQTEHEANLVKELFGADHFHKLEMKQGEGGICCSVTLYTAEEFSSERLDKIMKENSFIRSIQREDES